MLRVGDRFFFRGRFSPERPSLGAVYGPVHVAGASTLEIAGVSRAMLEVNASDGRTIRLPAAPLEDFGRPLASAAALDEIADRAAPDPVVLAMPWNRRHRAIFSLVLEGSAADAVVALHVLAALGSQRAPSYSERSTFFKVRAALVEEWERVSGLPAGAFRDRLPTLGG